MERIAIIGLGLMGGSLGLALRKSGFDGVITAYTRRAEIRKIAAERGIVDEVYERPQDAVAEADIVVFCTPVLTILQLVDQCLPHLKKNCILTDVGSTKSELMTDISEILGDSSALFIGSHPVAGSERTGLDAARADLYDGALVIITPDGTPAHDKAAKEIKSFWNGLGAHTMVMSAEVHDRLMARTSHLPHMIAVLLALTAGREGDHERTGEFCGTGFRDTTRIAEGSPEIWHDIISTNTFMMKEELRAFEKRLGQLCDMMDRMDFKGIKHMLESGCDIRRELMKHSPASGRKD